MAIAVSVGYWLVVSAIALGMFPIALVLYAVTWPFDRRLALLHQLTNVWASSYTWFNPLWTVRVSGREKVPHGRPTVMVANHQSLVDIFCVHRLFVHFKWVSKIEIFKIPVIGWNMALNRYIPLRRGDRDSVLAMLAACERTIARGSSVIMFPEGTRSQTGELKPFKPGAFDLAQRARVGILPVAIEGTRDALPKHGLRIGRGRMKVRVLDEIPYESFADDPPEIVAARVREVFVRALTRDPANGATIPTVDDQPSSGGATS
jgi:1-acyl-sn-glycerol-3-phosphate acyltransferase